MSNSAYALLLLGMGFVTYFVRSLPLLFLSHRTLPRWFTDWLDLVPVAILSSLIFPDILVTGSPRHLDFFQPKALVALPTLLFALKTKSLGGTVVLGMFLFWLAGLL